MAEVNIRYFVVLDFKPTYQKIPEIIEWTAMFIDTQTRKINKSIFHHYIKPRINPILNNFCKNTTGITQNKVNKGMDISDVVQLWNKYCIENRLVIKRPNKNIPNSCIVTLGDWFLKSMWPQQKCIDFDNLSNPILLNNWINLRNIYNTYYNRTNNKRDNMISILEYLGILLYIILYIYIHIV